MLPGLRFSAAEPKSRTFPHLLVYRSTPVLLSLPSLSLPGRKPMKTLERLSYIMVILAATLFSAVIVRQQLRYQPSNSPVLSAGALPKDLEGKTIMLPGVAWGNSHKSLVLAISSHCGYCLRSTDFYNTLSRKAVSSPLHPKLLAVMPDTLEADRAFLAKYGVRVDQVLAAESASFQVQGTPTLLLVNNHGQVLKEWIGLLGSDGQKQVISALTAD